MATPAEHEQAVALFFEPTFRPRWRAAIAGNPKVRAKLVDKLNHFWHLDERFVIAIPGQEQYPERIHELLRARGAPDRCYVIGDGDLEGQEPLLLDALDHVVDGFTGTILSCVAGRLAYFQGEDFVDRFILQRSGA